jgi:hypothetical protein
MSPLPPSASMACSGTALLYVLRSKHSAVITVYTRCLVIVTSSSFVTKITTRNKTRRDTAVGGGSYCVHSFVVTVLNFPYKLPPRKGWDVRSVCAVWIRLQHLYQDGKQISLRRNRHRTPISHPQPLFYTNASGRGEGVASSDLSRTYTHPPTSPSVRNIYVHYIWWTVFFSRRSIVLLGI